MKPSCAEEHDKLLRKIRDLEQKLDEAQEKQKELIVARDTASQ